MKYSIYKVQRASDLTWERVSRGVSEANVLPNGDLVFSDYRSIVVTGYAHGAWVMFRQEEVDE
jgi:hypothetical protein